MAGAEEQRAARGSGIGGARVPVLAPVSYKRTLDRATTPLYLRISGLESGCGLLRVTADKFSGCGSLREAGLRLAGRNRLRVAANGREYLSD